MRHALLVCVLAVPAAVAADRRPAPASPPEPPAFLEPDVHVLHELRPPAPGHNFGWVAETIGDVDGDRAPDLVIGAPSTATGPTSPGAAYVYSGATGALLHVHDGLAGNRLGYSVAALGDVDRDRVPDYAVGGLNRVIVVSGREHRVLHDLRVLGQAFGFDLNAAGDVDRDGVTDLIVGAMFAPDGVAVATGRVYVYSGATGVLLWTRSSPVLFGQFGSGVSGVDDLTGDRVPEQLVAAPGAGLAYVLSGVDGTIVRTLTPDATAGNFGSFFAHDAGDLDRDRVGDLLVTDVGDDGATGKAYVYSGATGARLLTLTGEHPGDGFGVGRGAGDLDRDHRADLILASWQSSEGAPTAGKTYLFSGATGAVLRTFTATTAGAATGFDALILGDVDRDHDPDVLITGIDVAYVIAGRRHGPGRHGGGHEDGHGHGR